MAADFSVAADTAATNEASVAVCTSLMQMLLHDRSFATSHPPLL